MKLEIPYNQYTHADLPADVAELIEKARVAAASAVASYSHFKVGAAVRLSSGEVVCGANVESEVYPAGICAERNVLFHVATAYPDERVEMLAVVSTSSVDECYPCGPCRQTILDTERRQGSPIRVVMAGRDSATVVESAAMLLPFSFKLK